ncbi:carbohydrate ABC transporter permease [Brachybacterium saurashtrense]|uniref:Sugar ABC transporter permease n=1 Tax=Brachybacterium saurashtrense TaxID=556288 RepID=A0A345YJV0_9MICO|nr:sugar ABC transporter permease [Brachybacterium saurashtrense]AXK44202.1 sugar ABC transporter permease [Brachybacterium saurashtrense]RRR21474.1 sugar ABC transporter permease [Brachybacterium saurashtrense]
MSAPTTTAPLAAGRRRPRLRRGALTMMALIAPSILLLVLINAYPLFVAALQSVRDGSLIADGSFIGLQNYADALSSPRFWKSAGVTLVFTLLGVFGSWAIGLALALLLRLRTPGRSVFRVLLLLPWVVPVVVSSTSWNFLVGTPDSLAPTLARLLGLGEVYFLADPFMAAVTVCVFKVWISFPFMLLMCSSALSSVDTTVYEAAGMDGASRWQQFSQITLPLISRSTYISWILMAIFCVNDFPTIYLLTGGGPVDSTTSLVVLAYRTVFQDMRTGPGVAIAFLMTLVLVVVSTVLYRQIRKADVA